MVWLPRYNVHNFVLSCTVECCLRYINKAVIFISVFHNESESLYVTFPYKVSDLLSEYLELQFSSEFNILTCR